MSNFTLHRKQHNALNEMLSMQDQLNTMTNGASWRSGKTMAGKTINWRRCIYMETAELIDSYPWKHWKAITAEVDMENARVELVDIWHFLLSLALENNTIPEALDTFATALQKAESAKTELDKSDYTIEDSLAVFEQMMLTALDSQYSMTEMSDCFFNACQTIQLDFDELYAIYMAKNVLNKFRQDHGYKEGTYLKNWAGKEDNVVMFEIIAQLQSFDAESLYKELKRHYPGH